MATADSIPTSVEYRDIPEYPGYCVGSDGTVWTLKNPRARYRVDGTRRLLRPASQPSGHLYVHIGSSDNRKVERVHRLILSVFVGPCPDGMECCHIDGDPANNAVSNLRWGTRAENIDDRNRHGAHGRGERNGRAKLTAELVGEIRRLSATGEWSNGRLGRKFGVHKSTIAYVVQRSRWE